jgi:FKBP-type peptidyl-prolyl cis-trans isomerase FkpA
MKSKMNWKVENALFFLLLLSVFSCRNDGYILTGSGLKYLIVKNGSGPEFRKGDYVEINMEYYDDKDSLLYSSITRGLPVTMLYNDSVWQHSGEIYEGLSMLKTGDSAIFKVQCRNLYLKSFRMPVPGNLDPESTITFRVGVSRVMTGDEFRDYQHQLAVKREAERVKLQQQQLTEDEGVIDEFLEKQHIIPMETESGLRYIIVDKGKGPKPQKGEIAVVNYRATLLDGTEFDSSYNKDEPSKFPIGLGIVVQGWEEGVSLMSKGAHYIFYIPSPLAYGGRSQGNIVGPNSILIYDTELLDIKKY